MATAYTHRIRRCNGNKKAWCLVALRGDGSEHTVYGGYTTAMTIDGLLRQSKGLLLIKPDDVVQIVYTDVG